MKKFRSNILGSRVEMTDTAWYYNEENGDHACVNRRLTRNPIETKSRWYYDYMRNQPQKENVVLFSSLELQDSDGNTISYEPESGRYSTADDYLKMLHDFIEYIKEKYPKYAHYTELIEILGEEVGIEEASARMQKPNKTLHGWLKRLRPIFDEFKNTIDYL